MDYLYFFFGLAIFIAVVLLLEGAYTTWNTARGPEAKRIARRLRLMSASTYGGQADRSILKKRLLSEAPGIQRFLLRVPRMHLLDRLIVQSGLELNVAQFCLLSIACTLIASAALLFLRVPAPAAISIGIAAAAIPWLYLIGKRRGRLAQFEQQLPDALDLMGRALRAGHALPSAIQMVSEEMPDPVAGEFRIVFDEVNYGVSMQDALKGLSIRVPGTDTGFFVVAVLIQRETGGNLTELFSNIAAIVRERLKLFGQIKVFSAEGRLSAWILGLMPFALAAMIQVVNPGFMKLLWTDPAGQKMLIGMLLLMLVGVIWMRKLIRIRV